MRPSDFTLAQLRFCARIRRIHGRSRLRRKAHLADAVRVHDAACAVQRAYRARGPPVKNDRDPITLEPLSGSVGRYFCYTTRDHKSRIAYSPSELAKYVETQDEPHDPVTRERYTQRDLDRLSVMSGRTRSLALSAQRRQRRRTAVAEVSHAWSMADVVVELARDLVRTIEHAYDSDIGMFEFLVTQWAPSFHMCVETAAMQDLASARTCLATACAIFEDHDVVQSLSALEYQLLVSTVEMAERSIADAPR
jgi:hypothetical protein